MDTHDPFAALAAFDTLDEIISAPVRPTTVPPAHYRPMQFEACRKCRGTGNFVSYSGRVVGPCFTCKGKGGKSYKTAPEVRAANRASAAARKVRTEAENLESFKAEQPAIWEWIDSSPNFGFAVSMRDAIAKYGHLTDNQLAACQRCVDRRKQAQAERAERVNNAPVISVTKIETALATALKNGLKRPRLLLASFKFSLAPATSANAGAIYVKEGGEYLGKITGGKFVCVRTCGDDRQAKVLEVAADPEKAAVAYGQMTGACSCCGRELTNGESIKRGIGPICAAKYGW